MVLNLIAGSREAEPYSRVRAGYGCMWLDWTVCQMTLMSQGQWHHDRVVLWRICVPMLAHGLSPVAAHTLSIPTRLLMEKYG